MAIQWYPGHMHKAQKEIKEKINQIDLIIELVDARIPYSSSNPVIEGLKEFKGLHRPIIKIMNKADLADPDLVDRWRAYFESQKDVKALPFSANQSKKLNAIIELCQKLAPHRVEKEQPIRAMIMGIPNVGKSTLINALAGRKVAKTGNEPAVTQRQQRIDIDGGITLYDTPGILWPKIENYHSSFRLAICAAIKDTVVKYDEITYFLMEYLQQQYPELVESHYDIEVDEQNRYGDKTTAILEAIGKKRGCLVSGGRVDIDKVCKILINDFRTATLGNLCLETPEMVEKELIEVEEKIRLKEEKKAAKKKKKKR